MSDFRSRIFPDTLRVIASSTITSGYAAVGSPAPLAHPTRIVKFTNNSTQDVTLSWDGTHDNEYIPAGSFMLLDVSSNSVSGASLSISAQTSFYVKGTAGTGNFYISTYYAA
jgi:hypothetical protein